ncbi:MAG: PH domain-containing protein [Bacillota bacterium]
MAYHVSPVEALLILFTLGSTILWVWILYQCALNEPPGRTKAIWIVVITLTHWVGAVAYLTWKMLSRRGKRLYRTEKDISFRVAPFDRTARLLSGPLTVIALLSGLWWWVLGILFSPRRYVVSPEGITIRAPASSYFIPANEIKSVKTAGFTKPGVGLTWLAGYFGYAGLFALPDGGTARIYATRWDRMVRVETVTSDPYLLSPAEPEAFVKAVRKILLVE